MVRPMPLLGLLMAGLLSSLVAPSQAQAQAHGPLPGGGRIDLGAGWRFQRESGGGGVARFGWQADRHWLLGVELGFNWYRLQPTQGSDLVTVGKIRVTGTYQILTKGFVLPYVAVGAGYDLITVISSDASGESGAAGFYGGLGLYFPLTERVGLVIEDRFDIANTVIETEGVFREIAGGGNLLWVGVVITFPPEVDSLMAP